MKDKICPICNNIAPFRITKEGVDYNQCSSCKTLFSDTLDNSGKVGGGAEAPRNDVFNPVRLTRIKAMFTHRTDKIKILDFGAGSGMFVNFMRDAGYEIDGYDLYNPEFEQLPKNDTYDLVNMCEVIEHLSGQFIEIKAISRYLKKGAILMCETSFIDIAAEDGTSYKDWFYLDPRVGHSTVFSHHSIDLLMAKNGLHPIQHIDRNVRLFTKK